MKIMQKDNWKITYYLKNNPYNFWKRNLVKIPLSQQEWKTNKIHSYLPTSSSGEKGASIINTPDLWDLRNAPLN